MFSIVYVSFADFISDQSSLCRDVFSTAVSIRGYSRVSLSERYAISPNIYLLVTSRGFSSSLFFDFALFIHPRYVKRPWPDSLARARGDSRVSGLRADFYRLIAIPRSHPSPARISRLPFLGLRACTLLLFPQYATSSSARSIN